MVKLYFCCAENFEHRYEELLQILPQKRREKTERYVKKGDRILSLMSGLMLKKVLGAESCSNFKYNEYGKPFIEHGPCFSLSHSGKYAVLAVAEENIGVDIETARNINKDVIHRFYTEEEQYFADLSTENALRIWTAKEAVLKLFGTGFSLSPKSFSVCPIEEMHKINGVKVNFLLQKLGNYPLTVAVNSNENEIEILEFQPEDLI